MGIKNTIATISTILSLVAVYLSTKQNILKWPLGIIANLLAIYLYVKSALYTKSMVSIVLLCNSFYGWYMWIYGGKNKTKVLPVTSMPTNVLIIYLFSGLFLTLIIGLIEYKFTRETMSLFEASSIFAILAHWFTAKKKIQSWILWIVIDCIFSIIFIYKSLYALAFKYFVYVFLSIRGYKLWLASLQKKDDG